jgi:hypothetical protein
VKKDNIPIFHGETKRKEDNECRVRTKLYDKRDDFNFPIVNFAFICSNIPAAPIYGVYISQLLSMKDRNIIFLHSTGYQKYRSVRANNIISWEL